MTAGFLYQIILSRSYSILHLRHQLHFRFMAPRANARLSLRDRHSLLRRRSPRKDIEQKRPHILPHVLRKSLPSSSALFTHTNKEERTRWKILFFASSSPSINFPASSNHAAHSVTTIGVPNARVDFGLVILYVLYTPISQRTRVDGEKERTARTSNAPTSESSSRPPGPDRKSVV